MFKKLNDHMHEGNDSLLVRILKKHNPKICGPTINEKIIDNFSSFSSVINASSCIIKRKLGVTDSDVLHLKDLLSLHKILSTERLYDHNIIINKNDVLAYCYAHMSFKLVEHVRLIYLTNGMRCITDEVHQKGTVGEVYMYPREIVKRAIELSASYVILIHNHPSGNVKPSLEDLNMTFKLKEMLILFDIGLYDHLIIGANNSYSFRDEGVLVDGT